MTIIKAVDLFCGAGGLTCGLSRSGIRVELGIDNDAACKYAYEENNNTRFRLQSVEDVRGPDLRNAFDGADLTMLAGCAPCQTFSTYNHQANDSDKRWNLLLEFARLISECQTDFVVMENVHGLWKQKIFGTFLSVLEENGYSYDYDVVNIFKYGIPQFRTRLVLVASRLGSIKLAEVGLEPVATVRDVVGKLPCIEAGEVCSSDVLHQSANLSDLNRRRIRQSKPGGTWRDWPNELVADCHKKTSGQTYPSVYGRMSWDMPAPTITTQFYQYGSGRFGHPEQDRAISLREGALLQGFPMDYQFCSSDQAISKKTVGRLIGNAVPVGFAEVIAKTFLDHVSLHDNKVAA